MNKTGSLKTNAVLNAILKVSEFLFPLITFPYVSRILLADGVGKVNFATSVVAYFLMFAQLGIPTYGVRECAKVRDDRAALTKTVLELFSINIISSLVAYAAFFIVLFTVPRFSGERPLLIIASLTILFNCIGMEWLYQGLEKYKYITVRSLIFKAIAVVAMFLLIHSQEDYIIYGAITIFAVSASNILNFINLHNIIDFHGPKGLDIARHIKPVLIFFAMSCATTVYMNLDNVMLGFMKGDDEVGFYSTAVKIKIILVSVVTSLGVVLLPRSAYNIEHGLKDEFARITRKAMNFVVLFGAPVSIYFLMFARECILVLSGEGFSGAVTPMMVIMPTVFFIGMSNITGIQILLPLGKEKIVLYSEIAGAVIDFLINLILIPRMASTGAAIGTLIAEILVWVIQFIALRRLFPGVYKNVRFILMLIALAAAVAASLWVHWLSVGNFIRIIISAVLFFGVYLVILLIGKEPLLKDLISALKIKFRE